MRKIEMPAVKTVSLAQGCDQADPFGSPQIKAIFAKQKASNAERKALRRLTKALEELTMEYLILVAVVSMMALYALIIVGCLKQPEW
jgi:hypothetical protein